MKNCRLWRCSRLTVPFAITVATIFVYLPTLVFGAPAGGQVVGGGGSISYQGQNTNISQTSQRMAIDWQTFNVQVNESVNFSQPNSSSVSLNRILDQNPSQIFGSINANGQVMLVNPNGLIFSETSSVNVGGLLASGLDINPQSFMNGDLLFNAVENTNGVVVNRGLLNAATGGSISLLGKSVQNEGLISANLGKVNLATGSEAILTFDNDGLIGIEVTRDVLENDLGIESATLNSGTIESEGGQVLMTAKVSQDLFSSAVNNSGVVEANSIAYHNGSIVLGGAGGNVVNSGTLDVSSNGSDVSGGEVNISGPNVTSSGFISADAQSGNGGHIVINADDTTLLTGNSVTSARAEANGIGGNVVVQGDHVGLFDQSKVDVSGGDGGGGANIGGGFQGSDLNIKNAKRTIVGPEAAIYADAINSGDGGSVVVWADEFTKYYGSIFARGGVESGDGGFVEVSGKGGLDYIGHVSTTAVNGNTGSLLLDPKNITISSAATDQNFPNDYSNFNVDGSLDYTLNNGDLAVELRNNDVFLRANNDINVTADVTSAQAGGNSLNNNLTLEAGRSIDLANGVTIALDGSDFTAVINHQGADTGNRDTDQPAAFTMASNASIVTKGGNISITTGNLSGNNIQIGNITLGTINTSDTLSSNGDNAGSITITNSSGDVILNNQLSANGRNVSGNNDGGNGGAIDITATAGSIVTNANGFISANGGTGGSTPGDVGGMGGNITLVAGVDVVIGAAMNTKGGTGGDDNANGNNGGNSGNVSVTATGDIVVNAGISTVGGDAGPNGGNDDGGIGGNINFNAGNNINVNGALSSNGGMTGSFIGDGANAGAIDLNAVNDINISAALSANGTSANGNGNDDGGSAGQITLTANNNITVDANISSLRGTPTGSGANGVNGSIAINGDGSDNIININNGSSLNSDNTPTISGMGGTDTLAASGSANTWSINGTSPGNGVLNNTTSSIDFTGIENLSGGTLVDQFVVSGSGWVNGLIDGGDGGVTDTINIQSNNNSVQLGTVVPTNAVLNVDNIESVTSSASGNTLVGDNVQNYWIINGTSSGSVSGSSTTPPVDQNVTFSGFGTLSGGTNIDHFAISADFSNTINGGAQDDTFVITNNFSGVLNGGSGIDTFDIQANISGIVNGDAQNDIFTVASNVSGALYGGDGVDTFNLQSDIAGTANGDGGNDIFNIDVGFSGNLNGGAGDDDFFVNASAGLSGNAQIAGGDGSDDFTIDALVTGSAQINGDAGNDFFYINANADGTTSINGGSDNDTFIIADHINIVNLDGGTGTTSPPELDVLDVSATTTNNTWNITNSNSGSVTDTAPVPSTVSFSNIESIVAGDFNDTVNLPNGTEFAGSFNGAGGTDTLSYQNWTTDVIANLSNINGFETLIGSPGTNDTIQGRDIATTWNVTGVNAGDVYGINFSEFENLSGGSNDDTFILVPSGRITGTISGGLAGANGNTLDASNYTQLTWSNLVGLSGDVSDATPTLLATFADIQNLISGGGDDTFTLTTNQFFTGSIDAGGGVDTLDYSAFTVPVVVDLSSFTGFEGVIGGGGTDELVGGNNLNIWTIDGIDSGNVNGITFSSFENLTGGSNDDAFTFTASGRVTGTISGGGNGANGDTLDASAYALLQWSNLAGFSGTLTDAGATQLLADFVDIENLISGAGDDTFVLLQNQFFNGSINAGGGTDTLDYSAFTNQVDVDLASFTGFESVIGGSGATDSLTGANDPNTWNIDTATSGRVDGITFSGFESLIGGSSTDDFIFANGIQFSGTINGGGGTDTLDYSLYNAGNTVNINLASLTNIENLIGGAGTTDVINGDNISNTWNITAATSGNVNGINFSAFEILVGGTSVDEFLFSDGIQFAGSIDGGAGTDTLNYSLYTAANTVNVNLAGLTNIENLIGGGGASDAITGLDSANTWNITGANSGNVNGITFSAFESLIGGISTDDFIFADGILFNGNIDGGAGFDTLDYSNFTASNAVSIAIVNLNSIENLIGGASVNDTIGGGNIANTWNIDTATSGDVNGVTFSAFENLNGGNTTDNFIFADGVLFTGNINGGAGTDTMDFSNYTAANPVSVILTNLNSIENLIGGAGAADTITGANTPNTWNITTANAGNVSGISFSAFENLVGGNSTDNFVFADGILFSGNINGSGGVDTLDFSAFSPTNNVTIDVTNLTSIENLIGGTSLADTIIGADNPNIWNVTAANAGSVDGIAFSNFENLVGGSSTDDFIFADGVLFAGSISGGGGSDSLDYSNFTSGNSVIIDIASLDLIETIVGGSSANDTILGPDTNNTWNLNSSITGNVAGVDFSGFENLVGGTMDDTFQFTGGQLFSGNIDGGAGFDTLDYSSFALAINVNISTLNSIERLFGGTSVNDTLTGADINNTWNITADNAGNVAGLVFSGFENLTGGSQSDVFMFADGVGLTGAVDGGAGTNTLNYSAYTTQVIVDRRANSTNTTGIGGQVTNITAAVGGQSANDELIGLNQSETWFIRSTNGGDTASGFVFSAFENLTGGNSADTFNMAPGASVSGAVNGGAGTDTLDYSSYTTNISVDLASGTATSTGSISSIEGLVGSQASNDILAGLNSNSDWIINGNNSGNIDTGAPVNFTFSGIESLIGGSANDTFTVLSGGSVSGQISGRGGDDSLTVIYSNTARNIAFDGGAQNTSDTVILQGTAAGQNSQYQFDSAAPDSVANTINFQVINMTGVEQINDEVTADSLTINGSAANDTINIASSPITGNNPMSADLVGFTSIDSSNKTNVVIDGQDGVDVINLLNNLVVPSSITFNAEIIANPSSSLISAADLVIVDATSIGAPAELLETAVDRLQLTNVNGDVFMLESNDIELLDSTVVGSFNLNNLAGNITASGAMTVSGGMNITGANLSSLTFNNSNNLVTGPVSFDANGGVLSNVDFVNSSAVELAGVNTTDLTITANGPVTDSGSVLVANQASFNANGNDVVLDEAGNDFGTVTIANAGRVTVNDQSDIGIGSITATEIALNAGGAVTDANGNGNNIASNSLFISAQDGIGDGNALETQVASVQIINSNSGGIGITNSGDLLLVSASNTGATAGGIQISTSGTFTQQGTIASNGSVNVSAGGQYSQLDNISVANTTASVNVSSASAGISMTDAASSTTTGGNINYSARNTVNVSSLDAVFGGGRVEITSDTGDILSTRAPNRSRPNVTGGSAFFNADFGSLGTIGRPLVVNVPGTVVINTLTSVDPIYLVSPDPLINQSRVLFGINDAKAEVGGNQRTEVDALAIIDPAIFTKVKNYREDDSPIKLPADQLVEEDDDKYKNKQDPDVFEQEKPFDVESSLKN